MCAFQIFRLLLFRANEASYAKTLFHTFGLVFSRRISQYSVVLRILHRGKRKTEKFMHRSTHGALYGLFLRRTCVFDFSTFAAHDPKYLPFFQFKGILTKSLSRLLISYYSCVEYSNIIILFLSFH